MKQVFILNDGKTSHIYNAISQLNLAEEYKITIEKNKKNRSIAQNALLHMWIDILSKETGYHMYEIKILLKDKLLGYNKVINKKTGEIISELKSTSGLNIKEFTNFLKEIDVIASQHWGIQLPRPVDIYYNAMSQQYKGN